jgi:replicative DNA helicase
MAILKQKLSEIEKKNMKEIFSDPVKWAQVFLRIFNPVSKKEEPWLARWYQVQMLRDPSLKKVYRCGRRTGKTETMVVDMLWRACTKRNYRVVVVTPFENQIRLIFMRINEILRTSPLIAGEVITNTKNPYIIKFKNESAIVGFTAGNDAASVRGQKADWIYLDEVDYMSDVCYDAVTTIGAERADIGITMSSTPTGKRSHFYDACVNPKLGFIEHYHPSMHNPNWCTRMEAEFRAQLTAQAYVHEIEAEFGTQDTGVFPKDRLEASLTFENYAYNELTYEQRHTCERNNIFPKMLMFDEVRRPDYNPFRTMGVDWDKFGASSSIIILEFNVIKQKFQVIKRVEVPRAEYSYDKAVNTIIELNEIYKPAFIYCDAGAGEYQIEALHIHGDKHPASGLKTKVQRWQFSQSIEMPDPITHEIVKHPVKQLMVNQLTLAFERDRLMLSPFDEILYTQLINYEVEKFSGNDHIPVYTSKDEHFIDALGLAYLAMVLEFKELTGTIKDMEVSTKMSFSSKIPGQASINKMFNQIQSSYTTSNGIPLKPQDDLRGERQTWHKVSQGYRSSSASRHSAWGRRTGGGGGRSMW